MGRYSTYRTAELREALQNETDRTNFARSVGTPRPRVVENAAQERTAAIQTELDNRTD